MAQRGGRDSARSQTGRAATIFGVAVGVSLLLVMAMALVADRNTRLQAAQREAEALAVGAQRLVWVELRNLERALAGIAADAAHWPTADGKIAPELVASMRGVAARQPEFESIVLVDAAGNALDGGRGDRTLAAWARAGTGGMRVGPLQQAAPDASDAAVLPMAVPMGDGRHVLARLRIATLRDLLAGLAPDAHGSVVSLEDARGRVLVDTRGGAAADANAQGARPPVGAGIEGAPRLVVQSPLPDFPLRVTVARSRAAILQGWWPLVMVAVLLQVLYWLALLSLVRLTHAHARTRSELLESLADTAHGLRQAQALGRTGSWSAERDRVVSWSPEVGELFGMDSGRTEAPITEFYERMHEEDRERVAAAFARAWATGEPFEIDYRMQDPAGGTHWLAVRGACVPAEHGRSRMRGTVVDITDRMQVLQRLRDAEQRFRLLFERNPLPFWVFDVETLRFLEVNDTAVERYGYTREEFLSMTVLDIRPEDEHEAVRTMARAPGEHRGVGTWRHRRKDGSEINVRIYTTEIEFEGRHARLVLAEDVTQQLAWQEELAWRAEHDPRTGLLNADAVADAIQARAPVAYGVAYVQLRGLELIEDSLGLHAGEAMLRAIASRMARLGREYGVAGHVRGDELVLVVLDPTRCVDAVEDLRCELSQPVGGRDTLQRLEFWLGTAEAPADGDMPAQVIANAGLAAHTARTEGVQARRFEPRMARGASERLQLASRLHRAIDAGAFALHYQLIRDVADGRAAALEALLRWPLPDGGFVPPSDFIQLAEDTGLIVPLGRWVLREAAATQRRLADAGFDLPIAINVSLAQCVHADLAGEVQAAVREFGLGSGALQVELTESILMTRPEELAAMLVRLRMSGVCVALDDFGTGFSSMSYLRHLPLDKLKIDRAFIANVDEDARSAAICAALLAMGHGLGLEVVAEGVERQAQFDWLAAHGCQQVQGFGLDRPMPLQGVLERLQGMPGDVAAVHGAAWPRTRVRAGRAD